ncbi:MAG TPA: response regulator transcription factor [Candidatus Saccharimonadales bacterium]|nr:response regulator transcription factor [Candidatus Saccharimonadales bacterium]
MKILIIEDNRPLAASLKKQLSRTFVVEVAHTGESGLHHAVSGNQDVIILDLNLPDTNGFDLCRTIRANGVQTPILVLTGMNDMNMRVNLLNTGADDYVTKPFNMAELRARLNALLRRPLAIKKSDLVVVRDLVIDPNRRHVERAGVAIELRRKEFDILEYLARNPGRAVTRAMILDNVWESSTDTWNNTVDVHIKHLRDKIDRPFAAPLIKTAYGIGYMLDDM